METEFNTMPSSGTKSDLNEISEIAEFFAGKNVLITGGSGFLGKLLIEKLLRSCPKIQKMFLIMRAKKGKTSTKRFEEHFEDVVYDRLKQEQPDFSSKVVMVEGELGEASWNMTPENRNLLKSSHVVFHGAATVRFDEKLRLAVNINVRGTKEMLLLAREMPNLKAFIHIGTAFSHCVSKTIDEVFYQPPVGCDELITLVDLLDDDTLQDITTGLVGKWPNTYAFTKTIAENAVQRYSDGLPVSIVRPSIMIGTHKEPISGWINNLYGPTGVVFGVGIGLLHTLHCRSENVADIIPADYVINNIIAAAWDISKPGSSTPVKALEPSKDEKIPDITKVKAEPPIYNSVSSCQNPITWGEYMKFNEVYGMRTPSLLSVWYYFFTLNRYLFVHNIFVFFTHIIPAIIGDTLARLTGRDPILLNTYKKIHKFTKVISYFCTQQWTFRNENVLNLWRKLPPADRKLFYFNLHDLDWNDYYITHVLGLRIYLIKDPLETIEPAKIKYKKLKYAHYTLMTVLSILGMWLAYHFLRFFVLSVHYIFSLW